jgi:surfeit locus 1 family protein
VQQTGAASEGLLRQWPQAGSGAEKNYGYAFQWWAIAVLIAILYVWFQFVLPRRRPRGL